MIDEIAEKAKSEVSKQCDEFEIYIEKDNTIELDCEKEILNFAKEEFNFGIGIRVINNNKLGFAYTNEINEIAKTAKQALENSKENACNPNFDFAETHKYREVKGIYDSRFENFDLDEAIDFMKTLIASATDNSCEITSGGFSASMSEVLIINSKDVEVADKSTGFSSFIALNAERNGEKSTAYDSISSNEFNLNPEELGNSTSKLAIDSIGGSKIETSDMNVVLDYHAAAGLLNAFISAFNSDNVLRGRSILADKVNQDIVSPNLSIYDDGLYEGGLASFKMDDEGTPSQKTTLIENGVLKGFIYDIYNANKASLTSTGNGFRGAYLDTPSSSTSNVIFDFNEKIAIEDISKGFLATDVLGAHTANPISGDFSVEANNAFLIENGEVCKPIKKAMISGNIFDALSNCQGLDSKIKQYGSFIIPKLSIDSLRVVGN
ncbi:TldD/PmbA family protein [Methanobrevibacter filiformis]|uniref:Metalloprotease TldD n=1 Tax=Methanobrevibacter filiformis TaxID=55758 RepID=A0A166F598_9EURY|nr:TldD/PmbA family protein [Methanobrevibacter filiformis]KZX17329.1 metalloprotease TldD [Methanobrevibacter filiformis]